MNTVVQEHWNGDEDMARGHAAITAEMSTDKVDAREASAAYDKIDRYLRNSLDDDDYAEYSAALDLVSTQPEGYVLVPVKDAL